MKISIVTAYYNRRQLLINTLESITHSKIQLYEFIVVDDGSDDNEKIKDLEKIYSFLKVIEIKKNEKNYINPCIPYNKAIQASSGDVVIIQNPECFHCGDILSFVFENIKDNNYLVFGCYSLTKPQTLKLTDSIINKSSINIQTLPKVPSKDGEEGWYQHSILNPRNYHFCTAITKNNLNSLKGFDEFYANGRDFDDNEFLYRVKKQVKNIVSIDEPFVYHQYHYNDQKILSEEEKKKRLELSNKNLFYRYTLTNLFKTKLRKFTRKYINNEKLSFKEVLLIERIIIKSIESNMQEYKKDLELIWKELLIDNAKILGFKSVFMCFNPKIKNYISDKFFFLVKLLIKVIF